jgi:sterol desaturase/sphingolipid hydroxylase (fatty acid hydroxylase superfamily)
MTAIPGFDRGRSASELGHAGRLPRRLSGRSRRALVIVATASAVVMAIAGSWSQLSGRMNVDQLGHTGWVISQSWQGTFLDWKFWCILATLASLERFFPARRGEGLLHVGASQDVVYFVLFAVLHLTIVRLYFVLLNGLASEVIPGIGDHLESVIGTAGTIALVFVLADFLNWGTHLVRHRVPLFWHFHEVHHSQRSLNMLTESREHFFEAMIASTVAFVPVALLGASFRVLAGTVTLTVFYNYFQHSNIRTNLGPLRHILVTPQSHRVHHSIDPEHHDTNFGVIFSVWDRIFRTRFHGDGSEYPATGVDNPRFPLEATARPASLLKSYAQQMIYPFRAALGTESRESS